MTRLPPPPRRFTGDKLVIASHNAGKVREIAALIAPFGVTAVSAAARGLAEPEETGASFRENAEIKALAAARGSGLPALADDSGLAVDSLGGAPGIRSARWAGAARDFAAAMRKVEEAVAGAPGAARFVCALSLAWPDGHVETVEGEVRGHLRFPPRGDRGFGYDPIFVPEGHDITFGEMDPEHKHAISHRADAFRKLIARCFGT
ncbi:MAG: RdgB/HAM1 family non-canonical purine NTP pyrophosphatase [Rhodothalassiaceae bacterium]